MRFDIIIIGAGPAGLAAGIQLARYNYSVLAFDGGDSRTIAAPKINNYLGFPQGISGKDFLRLGREQAQLFGTEIVKSQVSKIEKVADDNFKVTTSSANYNCRCLIFATGVEEGQPDVANRYDFIGRSLYYSLSTNGYEFSGSKAAVLGHDKFAAVKALDLLDYTHDVCILTNGLPLAGDEEIRLLLAENNIEVITDPIERMEGKNREKGQLAAIVFQNGKSRAVDTALSTYGVKPNSALAKDLGIATDHDGFILVDESMQTNISRVYAVGDVAATTRLLILGVAEGVKAALDIHNILRSPTGQIMD
ncbi:MAG: NAD(P)/FAD-dependent oxidoreductase [Heliobacteriaceae bacterium]|nr:NAD(P)/FAD-dependent oxidoreductase [Heliobacteriaceae bacterium]MDD4586964.1 NAD(P)/FAD-dependent oxidoreductase [Heliobacteriaceae bacterium]